MKNTFLVIVIDVLCIMAFRFMLFLHPEANFILLIYFDHAVAIYRVNIDIDDNHKR